VVFPLGESEGGKQGGVGATFEMRDELCLENWQQRKAQAYNQDPPLSEPEVACARAMSQFLSFKNFVFDNDGLVDAASWAGMINTWNRNLTRQQWTARAVIESSKKLSISVTSHNHISGIWRDASSVDTRDDVDEGTANWARRQPLPNPSQNSSCSDTMTYLSKE
jgi:hypothetical protein